MKLKYFIIVFCLLFLTSGCGGDKSPVLAKVRGENITLKDFEDQIRSLPPAYRSMVLTPAEKKEILERMITEKLLIQEAIKERLHCKSEFQEKLKWLKNQMLIEEMIKTKVYDKISVSDEEAKEFYNAHEKAIASLFKGKPFEEIKQDVKQLMRKDDVKARAMFMEWIEKLKKDANVTKNLALLEKSEGADKKIQK